MGEVSNESEYFSDDELHCILEFKDAWEDYTGKYDENWDSIEPYLDGIQNILHKALIGASLKSEKDKKQNRDTEEHGKKRRDILANTKVMTPFYPEHLYGSAHTGDQDFRFSVEISPNYEDTGHQKKGLIRWMVRLTPKGKAENWEDKKNNIQSFIESNFDDDVEVTVTANHFVVVDFDEFSPDALSNPDEWFENLVESLQKYHPQVEGFLNDNEVEFARLLQDIGFRPEEPAEMPADGRWSPTVDEETKESVSKITRRQVEQTGAVILQGPPGTGKTHATRELLKEVIAERESDKAVNDCQWSKIAGGREAPHHDDDVVEKAREKPVVWDIVQLHPGYSYEDFIRGMGTKSTKNDPAEEGGVHFESRDRILVELAEMARKLEDDQPVVLILDEINRCNLASVLGELILTLEKDKRSKPGKEASGWPVQLQYPAPDDEGDGGNSFTLPENLWLIGTMNTADRSLAMVDYAIRRRFRFIDVLPDAGAIDNFYGQFDDVEWAEDAAEVAGKVLEGINEHIDESRLEVGHSYFLVSPEDVEEFAEWCDKIAEKIVFEVVPLLREYHREGRLAVEGSGLIVSSSKESLKLPIESTAVTAEGGEPDVMKRRSKDRIRNWLINNTTENLGLDLFSAEDVNEELLDRIFYFHCPELQEDSPVTLARQWDVWSQFGFVAGKNDQNEVLRVGDEGDLVLVYMPKNPVMGYVGIGLVRDDEAITDWAEIRDKIIEEHETNPSEFVPDECFDPDSLDTENYVRVDWLARIEEPESDSLSTSFLNSVDIENRAGQPIADWRQIYTHLFEEPDKNDKRVSGNKLTARPFSDEWCKFRHKAPLMLPLIIRAFEEKAAEGKTVEESFDREQLPPQMEKFVNRGEDALVRLAADNKGPK